METLSAPAILSLLETNKEQRQSFISNIMQELESGTIDPLKIYYQLKCTEKILEEITSTDEKKNKDGYLIAKRFRDHVLTAAEKYGVKEFDFYGAKVKLADTGIKYDYSQCNDAELGDWELQALVLKEKIDARKKLLQEVPQKGMIITNEETGETYTVYPPSKSSTSFITMSLK